MPVPQAVSQVCDTFLREIDRRLPGRLTGLFLHGSLCWAEFVAGSDVDFVGVWDELPTETELGLLRDAHDAARLSMKTPTFDGFHCTAADLASDPAQIASRPVFYEGRFDPAGRVDINLVTWHELAERGVVVRGSLPPVHTDLEVLLAFTRHNLDTYWRDTVDQIESRGVESVGADDEAICWVGLGAARLHHLLRTRELTSKSGAGRHVCTSLDERWHRIAREALRIRETPSSPSLYDDPAHRGRDVHALLRWLVDDGVATAG